MKIARSEKLDYKAMFNFNRYEIDQKIENFDLITNLAIDIFSSVWGSLFRNKNIEFGMRVRCNHCFVKLYFEDVVRFVYTIKDEHSAYTPILKSYFLFLLDYSKKDNIFFSGNIKFFNFAILNKLWFAEKWVDYIKREQQYYILINNKKSDVLLEVKKKVKKVKVKHTIQTKKIASFHYVNINKFFNDNYLLVSTLLKHLKINVCQLSGFVGYDEKQIVEFMEGQNNRFLCEKLIDLFYINRVNKGITLLELTGQNINILKKKFESHNVDSLVDVLMKMYCMEYCDNINQTRMFNFHLKRFNKPANRRVFEGLALYFLWLNQDYKNDIRKLVINYWNSIFREWKKSFSDFKLRFLLLDSLGFCWEKSLFLSRSASSFFVDKSFSQSFVVSNKIIVNSQVGKVFLKDVKNLNRHNHSFLKGSIKIDKTKKMFRQKKNVTDKLYTKKELDFFEKISKERLEKIMDEQSEVFTDSPEIDQKRFDQLQKIFDRK